MQEKTQLDLSAAGLLSAASTSQGERTAFVDLSPGRRPRPCCCWLLSIFIQRVYKYYVDYVFFTAAWRPCLWMPQNSLTSKEKIPLFWTDVEASLDWNIFFRFANRRNFSIFKKFSFHELQFFTQTLLLFRAKLHATFLLSISLLTDQTKFLFLLIITLFSIQYA